MDNPVVANKNPTQVPTNPRKVTSFVPAEDVRAMIQAVKAAGGTIDELVNGALKECGPGIVARILEEKQKRWAELDPNFSKLISGHGSGKRSMMALARRMIGSALEKELQKVKRGRKEKPLPE